VVQEPLDVSKEFPILCVMPPLKRVIISFHFFIFSFSSSFTWIHKLTSIHIYLVFISLILLPWIKVQNMNFHLVLESPQLEFYSSRYQCFLNTAQPEISATFQSTFSLFFPNFLQGSNLKDLKWALVQMKFT